MGMKGRLPQPTETLKLRGSDRPARARRAEPKGAPGLPPRPTHVVGYAAECWDDLAAQLEAMRVVQRQDARMFEALCVAYDDARRAQDALKDGFSEQYLIAEGVMGTKMRPEVTVAREAWKRFEHFCVHFGLSPASRAKVRAASPEKKPGGVLDLIRGGK